MNTGGEPEVGSIQYLTVNCSEARRELEWVLSDPQFQCSERNKKFLRFVSEELFAGRESALKAYSIAVDVFGRPSSFDAATDPIVRIEATRLRSALSRYYEMYGSGREVSIELPKGRYVPMFSRHHLEVEEALDRASRTHPHSEESKASGPVRRIGANAFIIVKKLGLAGTALLAVAVLAAYALLNGLNATVISERPTVVVDLQLGGADDHEAIAMRDRLMSSLSAFSTLRLSAPDAYTSSTIQGASVAPAPSRYRLVLKYNSDPSQKAVWWQVIDQQTGEALQSDNERIRIDTASPADPVERLVSRLAVRIASVDGVINTIETYKDLEYPTLGNGCFLRASLALSMQTAQALAQARQCLESTLQQRPYDADAHAMLTPILLAIEQPDMSTELTRAAREHAERAVALAPESSRSFTARMMAEFRVGHIDASISAGRRAMLLNPNNTRLAAAFARILYSAGKWSEGAKLADQALQADGLPLADAEWTLAFDAYRQGQLDDVLLRLRRQSSGQCYLTDLLLTATLGRLGREGDASAIISDIRKTRPEFERSFHSDMARRHLDAQLSADLAHGLQLAGLRLQ